MTPTAFLDELVKINWVVKQNKQNPAGEYDVTTIAAGRFTKAPAELKEFVQLFESCANKEDNTWFLSVTDYAGRSDAAFAWNEFELQSLEVAEKNEIPAIEKFWAAHLPFLLSVKNGYAYIAVVLHGADKGKVVIGNEPEYEDTAVIAAGIQDFFPLFISFLKGEIELPPLNILK